MSNFSERIKVIFSANDKQLLDIFTKEVERLLPILNKKYNKSITLSDIKIEIMDFNKEDNDTLQCYSGFGLTDDRKYLLGIHTNALNHAWSNNLRPRTLYKSIDLFAKDCACHELFHLYDYELHGKLGKHIDWFIDNYAPNYSRRVLGRSVTGHDFRSDYTKLDPIFSEFEINGVTRDALFSKLNFTWKNLRLNSGTYLTNFVRSKYLID